MLPYPRKLVVNDRHRAAHRVLSAGTHLSNLREGMPSKKKLKDNYSQTPHIRCIAAVPVGEHFRSHVLEGAHAHASLTELLLSASEDKYLRRKSKSPNFITLSLLTRMF